MSTSKRSGRRSALGGLLALGVLVVAGCGAWAGDPSAPAASMPAGAVSAGAPAVRAACLGGDGLPCPPDPNAPTTTPPTSVVAAPVRVVAAGDIACGASNPAFNQGNGTATECRQLATAAVASSAGPADVLALGDLQYDDVSAHGFQQGYALSWGRFDSIVHPVLGNHEYDLAGAPGYFAYFGPRAGPAGQGWYSYDEGAWHVVVLNANCTEIGGCGPSSAEGQWLQADLAASTKQCTLAAFHQPYFSSSTQGDISASAPLWTALYQAGADLVLNGHRHFYERFAPMNVSGAIDNSFGMREIIVGTGGRNLDAFGTIEPSSQVHLAAFGVLSLDLGANGYSWRFIDENGAVRDSGTGTCHGKPA